MNFPEWIYDDLERKETIRLVGDHIMEDEEEKIVKKMALVGLWCIQTNPTDRPPIRKVIGMLEGSLEALQVPPKPLFDSHLVAAWETIKDSKDTSTCFVPLFEPLPTRDFRKAEVMHLSNLAKLSVMNLSNSESIRPPEHKDIIGL
ncbi:hypothetical protein YC2023_008193 [Brassica napus]